MYSVQFYRQRLPPDMADDAPAVSPRTDDLTAVYLCKINRGCQARFGRDTFGRPFLVGPNLVQHIWSGPYLVQPIFGPNPYLVGAIFGPTKFGRCHIWSNQIWSVPYLVHPNLVSIYLVCTKYKLSNQHLLST